MKIGNKVIDYSVFAKFDNKKEHVEDTTSLQLPSMENLTDSIKGAGIMGEIDWPTLAQVGALTFAASFRNSNKKAALLYAPMLQEIEVRWVVDKYDSSNNKIGLTAHKAFLKGMPKKLDSGKIETNVAQEGSFEMEVVYYNHMIDGVSILEIDKFNYVFKVNGVDYAKSIRDAL